MPALPINSIIQLTFEGVCQDSTILHIRNFVLQGGGVGDFSAQEYQEAFLDYTGPTGAGDLVTPYLGVLTSSYQLIRMRAQIVSSTRFSYSNFVFAMPPAGLRAASPQSLLQAGITVRSMLAGRKEVADYKIGPITAGDAVTGVLGADLKGKVQIYANTFGIDFNLTLPSPAVWRPCIWHSTEPSQPQFSEIISETVQNEVRGKTTRTLGRGI